MIRLSAIFAGLLFICGTAGYCESSTTVPEGKVPIDAALAHCPDGHAALRDVPILYGQVGPLYKKPEEYNEKDKEIAAKEARGEIILGGDFIMDLSPKSRVVCKICGFQYFPSAIIDAPDAGHWLKQAKSSKSFRREFSEKLRSFPLLSGWEQTVDYCQSFNLDGKTLNSEGISYETNLPVKDVLQKLREWVASSGGDPIEMRQVKGAAAEHTYEYQDNKMMIFIRDETYWKPGWRHVDLSLIQK